MEKSTLAIVLALIALMLAGSAYIFIKPVQTAVNNTLGAVTGPDSSFPCETHNGVTSCFAQARFTGTASTTLCSFKSPTSTSTLTFGSVQVTTATTTAISIEIGKATTFAATTTGLGYMTLASGAKGTLLATTTQIKSVDDVRTFAPNTYFNVMFGGAALGPLLAGTCNATFIVN